MNRNMHDLLLIISARDVRCHNHCNESRAKYFCAVHIMNRNILIIIMLMSMMTLMMMTIDDDDGDVMM